METEDDKEKVYHMAHFPKKVSKEFYKILSAEKPTLMKVKPLLRLFELIALSSVIDKDTGNVMLSRGILANLERKDFELMNNRYSAVEFLNEFKSMFPDFSWKDADHAAGKCRQVALTGFSDKLTDAVAKEAAGLFKGPQVFLVNGAGAHGRNSATITAEYEEYMGKRSFVLNSAQSKIIDYLKGLDVKIFSRKFNENMESARNLIETIGYDEGTSDNSKKIQYRTLKDIEAYAKPHYKPSASGNTSRLGHANSCVLGLKREIRKELMKGWYECDLRSSQLSILAAHLESEVAIEFLKSGKSIWNELSQFVCNEEVCSGKNKKVFKEAMYSIAFGKKLHNLNKLLRPYGLQQMLNHPIMIDLLKRRSEWFHLINAAGGATDCFGKWMKITPEREDRKVAASYIQAIEMALIAPAFDVARDHGNRLEFKITTFQHDGFSLSIADKRNEEKIRSLLTEAIKKEADRRGIITTLEMEILK
jgi:hypothetical protein